MNLPGATRSQLENPTEESESEWKSERFVVSGNLRDVARAPRRVHAPSVHRPPTRHRAPPLSTPPQGTA